MAYYIILDLKSAYGECGFVGFKRQPNFEQKKLNKKHVCENWKFPKTFPPRFEGVKRVYPKLTASLHLKKYVHPQKWRK